MKFPNKITGINESVIPLLLKIAKIIAIQPIDVVTLYHLLKINDTPLFSDALSCLFAIGKIKVNENKELEYVS